MNDRYIDIVKAVTDFYPDYWEKIVVTYDAAEDYGHLGVFYKINDKYESIFQVGRERLNYKLFQTSRQNAMIMSVVNQIRKESLENGNEWYHFVLIIKADGKYEPNFSTEKHFENLDEYIAIWRYKNLGLLERNEYESSCNDVEQAII